MYDLKLLKKLLKVGWSIMRLKIIQIVKLKIYVVYDIFLFRLILSNEKATKSLQSHVIG